MRRVGRAVEPPPRRRAASIASMASNARASLAGGAACRTARAPPIRRSPMTRRSATRRAPLVEPRARRGRPRLRLGPLRRPRAFCVARPAGRARAGSRALPGASSARRRRKAYRRDGSSPPARGAAPPPDADACADDRRSGSSPLGRTPSVAARAPRADACWAALAPPARARALLGRRRGRVGGRRRSAVADDARPLVALLSDEEGAPREFASFLALVLFRAAAARGGRAPRRPRRRRAASAARGRAAVLRARGARCAPALLQRPTRLLLRHAGRSQAAASPRRSRRA